MGLMWLLLLDSTIIFNQISHINDRGWLFGLMESSTHISWFCVFLSLKSDWIVGQSFEVENCIETHVKYVCHIKNSLCTQLFSLLAHSMIVFSHRTNSIITPINVHQLCTFM